MSPETKKKLATAKKLIQARQYDKAREILWDVDDEVATKWLVRLDEIDPQPKSSAKSKSDKSTRGQQVKIGLLLVGLAVIGFVFIASQLFQQQSTEPILETSDAEEYCRQAGTTGQEYTNCIDEQLAHLQCSHLADKDYVSCFNEALDAIQLQHLEDNCRTSSDTDAEYEKCLDNIFVQLYCHETRNFDDYLDCRDKGRAWALTPRPMLTPIGYMDGTATPTVQTSTPIPTVVNATDSVPTASIFIPSTNGN